MSWVVKLGGSLARDPLLPSWLGIIAAHGGGRVAVIPGGGPFADAARAAQAVWPLDDVAAHNMAVLGMAQFGQLLHGLCSALVLARSVPEIRTALAAGRAAIWQPFELLRDEADALTSWDVTSDSLALWLGGRLDAGRVILVKSCSLPASADWDALSAAGIVDRRFPALARETRGRITLLERGGAETLRAALCGEHGHDEPS